MPWPPSAWIMPRLDITVATSVSPARVPCSLKATARIAMIWSPSTSRPAGVDRQAAVGVTVEGDAEVGACLDDGGLQRLDVGGAVAVVDVDAVGLAADERDPGTGLAEGARGDLGGGAVGGVDDDVQALEPVRQDREQVGDVAVGAVGQARDAPDVGPRRAVPLLAQPSLDAVLEVVGELVPTRGRRT